MLALKHNQIIKHIFFLPPVKRLSSLSNHTDQITYFNYLLSNRITDLQTLRQSHAYIVTTGNSNNVFFAAKLISLYTLFHNLNSSTKVFDSLDTTKDIFLWNSIIKSHFSNGDYLKSLKFYMDMRLSNISPDHFTIPMVATACAEFTMLNHGKNVHGLVAKLGIFAGNSAIGSSFIYMYSKCSLMDDAAQVFDEISQRDVVAWTALVIGYVQNGESEIALECLCEMHRIGGSHEKPNFRTFEGGLQACGNIGAILEGRCLHSLVIKNGIENTQALQSSLLVMYSKYGTLEESHISFSVLREKDLIAWTSMIGVYARLGRITECYNMFLEMQNFEIYPDGVVISCLLSSFGNSMKVLEGKTFHGIILRRNYELDQVINNALLSMYCRFGNLIYAENVLNKANDFTKEPWNLMVFMYNKVGLQTKCINLFREKEDRGIQSDSTSLVSVISSCSQLSAIHQGKSIHGYIIRNLMIGHVSISNSLIDMYGKFGNLNIAQKIFCRTNRDIVMWNTFISVHIHNGNFNEALALFDKMILENIVPNSATLVIVLSACSNLASLVHGQRIHKYIEKERFDLNIPIATALIDMYGKCGKIEKSREIFDSMIERDVISWNAMISAYGLHGDANSALNLFKIMEKSNITPNGPTFLAVLGACNHTGLVEKGKELFRKMQDHSIVPNLKHYACMVDLLGRNDELNEAEALVMSMPMVPDKGIWGTLLSSCNIHKEIEMGVRVAKRAIESDPENDGYYVMISNMYSSIGKWDEAEEVRDMMRKRLVKKKRVGWSAM